MRRRACLCACVAFAAGTLAGCGGGGRTVATHQHLAGYPVVDTHPTVETSGIPVTTGQLRGGKAAIVLSPTRLVFITSGSTSCVWLPVRLTVVRPTEIRIDMRINGRPERCTTGLVAFPIAVNIDPKTVDIHQQVTVRVAFKANFGGTTGVRTFAKTYVAPPA